MSTRLLPNYRWIKFPIAYLNDQQFMTLSDAAVSVYVKLYLLAARSDCGGLLCNDHTMYNLDYLAWHLRTPAETLEGPIAELVAAGFLQPDREGFRITRFMDEQGPGDNVQREKWAERQRKSRARIWKSEGNEEWLSEKECREEDGEEEVEVD